MGEMADFYIQQMQDAYGWNPHGRSREPQAPRCKHCGSTDVRWRQQGGKWVLFSSKPGVEHQCPARGPASADEFE